jgi:hypothetical protein
MVKAFYGAEIMVTPYDQRHEDRLERIMEALKINDGLTPTEVAILLKERKYCRYPLSSKQINQYLLELERKGLVYSGVKTIKKSQWKTYTCKVYFVAA